ncbi:VOC family protein [Terribacillus saccharophilus]|uniref:VOC family protein n=1 Tax=Terribacillus saccharophilus TaxID=361277 RepID=UPI003981E995
MTLEIAVFLSMDGKAKEAIAFYKEHLQAEELLLVSYMDMAERDAGMMLTEENKDYISHCVLRIGRSNLMIAEETMDPREQYEAGNNFSLCIQSANLAEIRLFYQNMMRDSRVKVIQPLEANVFSEAYGVVRDPFGVDIQLMYDPRLS